MTCVLSSKRESVIVIDSPPCVSPGKCGHGIGTYSEAQLETPLDVYLVNTSKYRRRTYRESLCQPLEVETNHNHGPVSPTVEGAVCDDWPILVRCYFTEIH